MSHTDAEKWDQIYRDRPVTASPAASVLTENLHLLPKSGTALDAACGTGANAIVLARQGLETHAWDISEQALDLLNKSVANDNLNLITTQRDIESHPPVANSFDVIVVSRFLDRSIVRHLISALRQGGLIYYQTFIKEQRDVCGPSNPAYRLDSNELLRLFSTLHLICYREEGTIGELSIGFRNEAMLIAQKR